MSIRALTWLQSEAISVSCKRNKKKKTQKGKRWRSDGATSQQLDRSTAKNRHFNLADASIQNDFNTNQI